MDTHMKVLSDLHTIKAPGGSTGRCSFSHQLPNTYSFLGAVLNCGTSNYEIETWP